MFRLILAALLVLAAAPPPAPPLHPSPAFTPRGPAAAAGVLVWLHGGYDTDTNPTPPAEPGWVAQVAADGFDIWRYDRTPGQDPLQGGRAGLLRGLAELRGEGYQRVMVAGDSRGAFIGLAALARPDLVDAVAAIDPAAHGTSPAMRPRALADFQALLLAAGPVPFALVQLREDPFDPNPDARAEAAREAAARTGAPLLLIDRPPAPVGHEGGYTQAFTALFGARLARFLESTN